MNQSTQSRFESNVPMITFNTGWRHYLKEFIKMGVPWMLAAIWFSVSIGDILVASVYVGSVALFLIYLYVHLSELCSEEFTGGIIEILGWLTLIALVVLQLIVAYNRIT
jgi:vacuolar-type H+-ATPase subunit I/STV1